MHHNSEYFQSARVSDDTFYKSIHKFLDSFVTATYNDYMELRKALR